MSNVTSEVLFRNTEPTVSSANFERAQRLGEALGACTIVRLSKELTFSDIFEGSVAVDESSLIYDRQGEQLDTYEILSQIS